MGGELSCQEKRRKRGTQKGTAEEGGRSSLASYAFAHSLSPSTRLKPRGHFWVSHPPQKKENHFISTGVGLLRRRPSRAASRRV